jgi:hypothetical protein
MSVVISGSGSISGLSNVGGIASAQSGSTLQFLNSYIVSPFGTNSTSFVDVTGVSVTITPSSASSKILLLITVNGVGGNGGSSTNEGLALVTDGTNNYLVFDANIPANTTNGWICYSANYLISPNTTSPITYKLRIRCGNGTYGISVSNYWNYAYNQTGITAMEIAA